MSNKIRDMICSNCGKPLRKILVRETMLDFGFAGREPAVSPIGEYYNPNSTNIIEQWVVCPCEEQSDDKKLTPK